LKKYLKYICATLVITLFLGCAVFAGDDDDPYSAPAPTTITVTTQK
jgi:hypothetical protein